MSVDDPDEERTWLFDLEFLTSTWTCIYGRGCPGIESEAAPAEALGCCNHGAYIADEDDRERVSAAVDSLSADVWQHRSVANQRGGALYKDRNGDWRTRVVDGACIMLNRPGFDGGIGCALHVEAERRGVPHLTLKPDVCWQVPLRREDHQATSGHVFSLVRRWQRSDWGGIDVNVHWWCTEPDGSFGGDQPVYAGMRDELVAIAGRAVVDRLVAEIEARSQT